jgi:triacylglycerol lipase
MATSTVDVGKAAAEAAVTVSKAWALCACVDTKNGTPPSGWDVFWTPAADYKGAYALVFQAYTYIFVLFTPVKIPLPIFAVAIQGTQDFKDFLRDFEVTPQKDFYPIDGAHIGEGSVKALHHTLKLTASNGQTLEALLQARSSSDYLLVTGHSLGGNVASVLTPWIASNVPAFGGDDKFPKKISSLPANLHSITFAAPTAGDTAFATFLNNNPSNYLANFNLNDVVPQVWAETGPLNINNVDNMWASPGPSAPGDVQKLIAGKQKQLQGVTYTQTNGTMFSFPIVAAPDDSWDWELSYQHNYAYCQQFLGAQGGCTPPPPPSK